MDFSAAAVIGQYGLLSVDYELTNFLKGMRLKDVNDREMDANNFIKEDFGTSGLLKNWGNLK